MDQTDQTARLVANLQRAVLRWTVALFLTATALGGLLRRRVCWGLLPGILLGVGSFQILVGVILRMKGATGAMFAIAAVVSLVKFGFLIGIVIGLWYLGLDLAELLVGLLVSQFAIVGACTGASQIAPPPPPPPDART